MRFFWWQFHKICFCQSITKISLQITNQTARSVAYYIAHRSHNLGFPQYKLDIWSDHVSDACFVYWLWMSTSRNSLRLFHNPTNAIFTSGVVFSSEPTWFVEQAWLNSVDSVPKLRRIIFINKFEVFISFKNHNVFFVLFHKKGMLIQVDSEGCCCWCHILAILSRTISAAVHGFVVPKGDHYPVAMASCLEVEPK